LTAFVSPLIECLQVCILRRRRRVSKLTDQALRLVYMQADA
jgi:hypothetical protein